jgi:hypothetical protein
MPLAAQNLHLDIHAQGGFLIPHRPALVYLRQGHSTGLSLTLSRQTPDNKTWQNTYNQPITGIELGYINTGNKEELGDVFSVNRIIELPLGQSTNSIFRLRLGGGMSYITKHFEKYDNVKNAAIGSAFNVSILLGLSATKIYDFWKISVGTKIQHFSNGSFTKPNLGINIPSVYLGLGFINKKSTNPSLDLPTTLPNISHPIPIKHQIIAALGIKSIGGQNNILYGAWSLSYVVLKNISPKFSWNGFADIGYNNSHPALLAKDNKEQVSFGELLQIGGGIGLYNHYGKTSIFLQTGFYAQSQLIKNEGFIYNKFGVEQKINQRFSAQLSLKSHLAKADYFALACVYTL